MAKSEVAAKLQQDVIVAMKAKDKDRLGVLRMLQAAVKQVEVDQRRDLDDTDVVKILVSYARKVKDQITSYGDAGPQDMGKVMKVVLAKTSGRADGGRVSALVKQSLVG
jgi:uncharacterized protein YqeY